MCNQEIMNKCLVYIHYYAVGGGLLITCQNVQVQQSRNSVLLIAMSDKYFLYNLCCFNLLESVVIPCIFFSTNICDRKFERIVHSIFSNLITNAVLCIYAVHISGKFEYGPYICQNVFSSSTNQGLVKPISYVQFNK